MTKIRALTSFRNADEIDGVTKTGEVYEVSDDYAKDIVEDKGHAEYVETEGEPEETVHGDYPTGFLDEVIPHGFPNDDIRSKFESQNIMTFRDLLLIEDYKSIKGISETEKETIEETIPFALTAWKDKNM